MQKNTKKRLIITLFVLFVLPLPLEYWAYFVPDHITNPVTIYEINDFIGDIIGIDRVIADLHIGMSPGLKLFFQKLKKLIEIISHPFCLHLGIDFEFIGGTSFKVVRDTEFHQFCFEITAVIHQNQI